MAASFQTFPKQGARVLVQVALLVAFLYFFGMPAFARFAKMEVMVVETTKQTNGIPVPAITISVPNQINGHSCYDQNSSIESCLERVSLNQSYILKSVVLGYREKREIFLRRGVRSDEQLSCTETRFQKCF